VALSLVLLAGAGLLMRSLVKLQGTDLGFRAEGVLTAAVQLPSTRYDFAQSDRFFLEALSRIGALPGVQYAAGASCLPIPFACIGTSFWRVDLPKPPEGQVASSHVRPVTPGFFKTREGLLRLRHVRVAASGHRQRGARQAAVPGRQPARPSPSD
jgi:hypothetical protein